MTRAEAEYEADLVRIARKLGVGLAALRNLEEIYRQSFRAVTDAIIADRQSFRAVTDAIIADRIDDLLARFVATAPQATVDAAIHLGIIEAQS